MPNCSLSKFVNIVPSCPESATIAIALEICSQVPLHQAVVLNELQRPVGVIYSSQIVSHLLYVGENEHQRSAILEQQRVTELIQPIATVSASTSVEQFSKLLRSQPRECSRELNWVLIDSHDNFLGIVDVGRLGQYLASTWRKKSVTASQSIANKKQPLREKVMARENAIQAKSLKTRSTNTPKQNSNQVLVSQSLVQLLEKLPWPLMVETSSGEVVAQNPAWWKHLESLKDPQFVQQQVEKMLGNAAKQSPLDTQSNSHKSSLEENQNQDGLSVWHRIQPQGGSEENLNLEPTSSTRCFLDSQPGTCTCVVEVENGQERVWRFARIPLDTQGANLENLHDTNSAACSDLWLILVTDITEQQRLCKELATKNADLIHLNRLKDEFLACISHELKTPLTAVLGLSRLLVDQQLGKLNDRQARYAGLIHQSGRHLMSVVNDILDLTRMETGQMELSLAKIDIQAVCDRALEAAKAHHAQNNKIPNDSLTLEEQYKFSFSIEPGLSEMVADDLRLRQMLGHLLSNAFKFTEAGGEIGLSISTWEGWVAFTVRDTGIGIPENQQHLIFQKFQQLENPLTRQFEGTGLGLVLTRALARLHGGDVSFLSREGEGSQFTLLLPPSPPQKRNGSEPDSSSKKSALTIVPSTPASTATNSNNLVLIVETVSRYVEELTQQLRTLGYQVVIARSGCEAIEKARRLQPQVIFINPLLPLLSGWDVLTLLKSDSITRHISVIVTATTAEKEQASAHRADGFLRLPVENQVLAPLLNSLSTRSPIKSHKQKKHKSNISNTPLRILRLVHPATEDLGDRASLQKHRVIEVDDLEQAEILKRVWHFDVVLLDVEMPKAQLYLQNLPHYPDLINIPLVTRSVEATQLALKIPQLSVFPCLLSSTTDKNSQNEEINSLLSVLQIAAGRYTPPSILVADLAMLPDLPAIKKSASLNNKSISTRTQTQIATQIPPLNLSRGSEWFQALVQYLQTAGLKAEMSRTWAEMLQQLRHEGVDLLLICWGESQNENQMRSALNKLQSMGLSLPPTLILDQRLNSTADDESIKKIIDSNATQILPRSISMEELLNQINQALN